MKSLFNLITILLVEKLNWFVRRMIYFDVVSPYLFSFFFLSLKFLLQFQAYTSSFISSENWPLQYRAANFNYMQTVRTDPAVLMQFL